MSRQRHIRDYDSKGRLETRSIDSDATYGFDYAYNNIGAIDTLTYPTSTGGTRVKLKYGYNYGFNDAIQDYTDDVLGTTYWDLVSVDQRGNAIDVDLGNTVNIIVGFEALTGLVDYKQSGKGASTTNRQELTYEWDDGGNLKKRIDDRQILTEEFFYDSMNRLDYSELGGTENLDLEYHQNGNIKIKDDVSLSEYVYDSAKIHAVITAGSISFEYDENGNAKKRNGSTIAWTSYNKPSQINGNSETNDFWYAPDRSRWKQVATYPGGTETTIYVGGLMEKLTVGSVTAYKHLITAPDGTNIQRVLRSDSSDDTFYLASDHLGSADVVLDDQGDAVVYTSFDAFGQRRDSTDWDGPPSASEMTAIADSTRRGYTLHEHLDNTDLVHMNGRVQDPLVGRFISADPYVQAPYFSESLNRYSYVLNDPLTYTDSTGFGLDDYSNVRLIEGRPGRGASFWNFADAWLDARVAQAMWWEIVSARSAQYRASTRTATNYFAQPDIQDDTLSDFGLGQFENEKRLLAAIGLGVWVEFVVAPIQDVAEGRILSAGCRLVKVCRAAGLAGGKIARAAKKLYEKRRGNAPNEAAEQLARNKVRGDAARDKVADTLREAGRDVDTEVTKHTPFGRRVIDVEVSKDGKLLGGVEVKTGNSRYLPSQRAKDEWLRQNGYPVDLVRNP